MCRITQEHPRAGSDFGHGGFTLFAGAFHLLDLSLPVPHRGPTTPGASSRFGLFRVRSPLLTESILFLFLRLLRCFTSAGIACFSLSLFRKRRHRINGVRLPHSEISGSKRMCRSPKLIAACHVLHRLLAPRHSSCALSSFFHLDITEISPRRAFAAFAAGPAQTQLVNYLEVVIFLP